jgi:hypothetical protein
MLKKLAIVLGGFAVLAAAVYGVRTWVRSSRQEAGNRALAQTATWGQNPSLAASLMVDEYGPPQWVAAGRLEWFAVLPWKRIVVTNAPAGFLEHAVSYRIPPEKLPELRRFGRGLSVDAQNGEFSARGESEEANLLCLNLASDIAQGKRTAKQAQEFYRATIQKSMAGKSSPYMERLLFAVILPSETEMPLP